MGQLGRAPDREVTSAAPPEKFEELLRDFDGLDRSARMELLIDWADHFTEVPESIAQRPFPERSRAPRCESDAYVFATDRPDGTLDFHFAVENPQGISAKAWGAILAESASGAPLEQVLEIHGNSIRRIFGPELSMGKGQGLIGMLDLLHHEARTRLKNR
jgi:cysteine desulfuration protein SufE